MTDTDKKKCKTPGAIYGFQCYPLNSMNMRTVRFSVSEIPSWVYIDQATARRLEKALHDAAERVLGVEYQRAFERGVEK